MWKKITQHKLLHRRDVLALLAATATVLAFPPIEWVPLIFLGPLFFLRGILRCQTPSQGFWFGFAVSFAIMLGGFYWVVYVIHVFGHLSWAVSTLLYLLFCGFAALNFPLFGALVVWLQKKFPWNEGSDRIQGLWFAVAFPALFTIFEYLVPKLFPWYLSHCLYRTLWAVQIVEWTGVLFLTFTVVSTASVILWLWMRGESGKPAPREWLCFPAGLWILAITVSLYCLNQPEPQGRSLKVALIQANIGSLEKVEARKGIGSKVRYTIQKYIGRSEEARRQHPDLDLIVWPETAMPFQLSGWGPWPTQIKDRVKKWGIPLLTGAYAQSKEFYHRDYNAAFLLEPEGDELREDIYRKNILLAFGEYFPFGEAYPILYRWFPQVSNFMRGRDQNPLSLSDGTRLGVTICYEAIVPSYYRKVIREGVHASINLTNDSWFGPTAEPYQHGALSVFRAIETRVPFFRVANTGISFSVDTYGTMSEPTGSYVEGTSVTNLPLPLKPPLTFYTRFGDWFVGLCGLLFGLTLWLHRRERASVSR